MTCLIALIPVVAVLATVGIESIIVYSLLLWGCWLAAQSLTPEGDT